MSLDPEVRRGGGLPFGMTCSLWSCDPRYSTNARTLYSILVTYADTQERHTEKGKPYRVELAAQLGVSLSTLDRTFVEMEVAGMVTIEERPDAKNPLNHDANIYHLHDAEVMWKGAGAWTDPLPSGVKAADVAKKVIEERRREKRAKGIVRKGGVPKGVNPKAVKAAKEAALLAAQTEQAAASEAPAAASPETEDERGGGSTHAATPGSTHAAGVAAPVLPNVYSPHQSPSPEPDAPSARSASDARRASTGSRAVDKCGSAASGKTRPPRLTNEQRQQVQAVRDLLPPDLNRALGAKTPPNIAAAIVKALATGEPRERTPQQLVEHRVMARWNGHWATRFYAGELPKQPFGPLEAMLRDTQECGYDWCEDRTDIFTREACPSCAMRAVDKQADRENAREHPPVSEPTATVPAQATTTPDPPPIKRAPAVGGGAEPNEYFRSMRALATGQRTASRR